MRVHAKFTRNNKQEELYFVNPIKVLDESMSLNDALIEAEAAQKSGRYAVVMVDYESYDKSRESFKIGVFDAPVSRERFMEDKEVGSFKLGPMKFTESREKSIENIEKVRDYIRDGHTYQANYTTRMHGDFTGDAHSLYEALVSNNNGGYTIFIEHEEKAIVSCSPELFFEINQERTVETRPMKGTAPRYDDADKDKESYEFLRNSKKDQAENVMIVDLLRNDISRISKPNTVKTPKLFTIEKYKTVFQMTSTVVGELRDELGLNEIFNALFPCGSITGAPKIKTMEIIEELETTERGIYCGAIGILYSDNTTVFNVPIRTLSIKDGQYTYAAGGGITYNSNSESEYEELLQKTKFLEQADVTLIETMRIDHGYVPRLDLHSARLSKSARHFNYGRVNLIHEVNDYVTNEMLLGGVYRLRATFDRNGLKLEHDTVPPLKSTHAKVLGPIEGADDFLRHKTSIRYQYFGLADDTPLILYYNNNHMITEFNIGNVVVYQNGTYYTPKSVKILNGVMRESLLQDGRLKFKDYSVDELKSLYQEEEIEVFLINSLREKVPVSLFF